MGIASRSGPRANGGVRFIRASSIAEELLELALDLPHQTVDDVDAVAEFPAQFAGGLLDLAVQAGDRAAALAAERLELPVQRLFRNLRFDLAGCGPSSRESSSVCVTKSLSIRTSAFWRSFPVSERHAPVAAAKTMRPMMKARPIFHSASSKRVSEAGGGMTKAE